MLTAFICGMATAAVLAWRRASHEPPAYQPGTFFALIFLAGVLAPAIPAALLEGGGARAYVVPLVLGVGLLLGVAACVRPRDDAWAEDQETRSPDQSRQRRR